VSLAEHLRPLLPARTRGRGRGPDRIEIVVIEDDGADFVHAAVHGRESHEVSLRLKPPADWSGVCTCPVFRRTGACRHLWATVREVDERGLPLSRAADPGAQPTFTALDPQSELWRTRLDAVADELGRGAPDPWHGLIRRDSSPGTQFLYVVDLDDTKSGRGLVLRPFWRERLRNHRWGRRRVLNPEQEDAPPLSSGLDLRIFRALGGARRSSWTPSAHLSSYGGSGAWWLEEADLDLLLPLLAETGRTFLHHHGREEGEPLDLDPRPPWELGLLLEKSEEQRRARLVGFLARGEERLGVADALHLTPSWVFTEGRVARFDPRGAWAMVAALVAGGPVEAPLADAALLADRVAALAGHPLLEGDGLLLLPEVEPRPHLTVGEGEGRLCPCRIRFQYGSLEVGPDDPRGALSDPEGGGLRRRNWRAEREALRAFLDAGGIHAEGEAAGAVERDLADELVLRLCQKGWSAMIGAATVREHGLLAVTVSSGVDWFDLQGGLDFDGVLAPLPALLAAVDAGRLTVPLEDGSVGLLPEVARREWALLDGIGQREGEALRFRSSQGWLLDRLLADRPGVDVDAAFARLRRVLTDFEGLESRSEPASFQGVLRAYQRVGLGWFAFLRDAGLGGCLADDMGLGKTVQVLALLAERRLAGASPRPSLVIVPRSLLFNWQAEARRFTPELAVLPYTGPERTARREVIPEHDLVLTTYGILRRDILALKEIPFDYVVLDEAQAIKNHRSHSAKASRLLVARHRLALSGTPVENHLRELWSLFEFLNPGMLGRAQIFRQLASARGERALDKGGRHLLAAALRPFILRRTKEQVLPDLPPKLEQILWCEPDVDQLGEYEALRTHYRSSILSGGAARFEVLTALLRLRQAACHPGLIDAARVDEGSAKLDVLLPHLEELVESGHKALVFSQFTSHLAILRRRLDAARQPYAYLDGSTRDREAQVRRFREDPGCPLFLMSLKAGGLGLNLVEADYVFLMDPWWNPAAETQAIDRAHRIGRERAVLAYRLITRGTVEEKVLALQDEKRALADALLTTDDALLSRLTAQDLELLFT